MLKQIEDNPDHWKERALENKRQGYIGEVAFSKLAWEAGLDVFWANPESRSGDKLIRKPWDFHIAQNQMEDGDIEIKTTLAIKARAWLGCKAHYVVFLELLNPEIVDLKIEDIVSRGLTASVQLIGYLKHEDVDKKKAIPGPMDWAYVFELEELRPPKEILEKLIKEENAGKSLNRMKQE